MRQCLKATQLCFPKQIATRNSVPTKPTSTAPCIKPGSIPVTHATHELGDTDMHDQ